MKDKILIFAGNTREASNWAADNELPRHDYTYIRTEEDLRGRRTKNNPRVFTDLFYNRQDSHQIVNALKMTDLY